MISILRALRGFFARSQNQDLGDKQESLNKFRQQIQRNLNDRIVNIINSCCQSFQRCCEMKYGICTNNCISVNCCSQ